MEEKSLTSYFQSIPQNGIFSTLGWRKKFAQSGVIATISDAVTNGLIILLELSHYGKLYDFHHRRHWIFGCNLGNIWLIRVINCGRLSALAQMLAFYAAGVSKFLRVMCEMWSWCGGRWLGVRK